MRMFAGLDVGFKRMAVCLVDGVCRIVWRGVVAHRSVRRRMPVLSG